MEMNSNTPEEKPRGHRVTFPLIKGTRPATSETEMTPERVKDLLLELDIQDYVRKLEP